MVDFGIRVAGLRNDLISAVRGSLDASCGWEEGQVVTRVRILLTC